MLSSLTLLELEFLKANYHNNTARDLCLSLNKLRKKQKLPLITVRQVSTAMSEWGVGKSVTGVETSIPLLPKLRQLPGAPPKQSPDSKKLKALKDFQSEAQEDGLSVSLEELMKVADDDENYLKELYSLKDDSENEDTEKDS